MVGRGAHEVEAERHVDPALEVDGLDRDQRLVVVHADRGVVAGARRRDGTSCRPSAGRRAACPRRASRATTGAITSISSRPIAPPSPACGLSPATAMRGAAIPKSAVERAVGDPQRRLEERRGQRPRHRRQRDVDRHRHHPEAGRRQHHHRQGSAAQVREELGMPREGEAGAVDQRLLVDRVGAERQRGAAADQLDPARDDRDRRRGVRRVGAPGRRRVRQRVRRAPAAPRAATAAASPGAAIARSGTPRRAAELGACAQGRRSGRTPARPRSAFQALSAISAPIPAGSPRVSATGSVIAG